MGRIQSTLVLNDQMSKVLHRINQAVELTIDSFEAVQRASGKSINVATMTEARQAIGATNSSLKEIEEHYQKVNNQQQKLNQGLGKGASSAGSFVKAIAGLSVVQSALSVVTGQVSAALDRMDTMSNFQRTMTAITGSSQAANSSLEELKTITKGTAYGLDTAAAAVQNFTTRGMSIKSATLEVGKWADAVAFYGDGTNEALTSVTDAIGKMLSKGTVEMDQLNRLTDSGINAVGMFAQATGQSTATVQNALSKGEISSQKFITTVSSAFSAGTNGVLNISGAAKEAGGTWATSIANAKAAVTRGITSIIDSVNAALTQAGFGTILTGIQNLGGYAESALEKIGNKIAGLIEIIAPLARLVFKIGSLFVKGWSIISPIILGIATAFAAYNAVLFVHNTMQKVSTVLKTVAAIAAAAHGKAISEEKLETIGMTTAQLSFNAALYACPLTWIVAAIIAVIAITYAVVAAINKVKGTTISATGVIFGAVCWLGAAIWNTLIGLINGCIQFMWTRFVEPWIGIIEWVLNVFNGGFDSFGDAVKNLLGNIISWFLSLGKVVTKIVDAIFGTDWSGGLNSLQDKMLSWGKNENSITLSREAPTLQSLTGGKLKTIDYKEAWNKGYSAGEKVESKVSGLFGNLNTLNSTDGLLSDIANSCNDTANNTAKSKDELSYLRDIAEREAINRFTTAEIKVDLGGVTNNVAANTDLDGVISYLTNGVAEALVTASEGVY